MVRALTRGGTGLTEADQATTEVMERNERLSEAFAARDADHLMAHYWRSPELFTVGEGGGVTEGWEAARAFQERFFAASEAIDLSFGGWNHFASRDDVLATCPFSLTAKFEGGGERRLEGWYTNLRRRIGGEWLIVFEHISSNASPPGSA